MPAVRPAVKSAFVLACLAALAAAYFANTFAHTAIPYLCLMHIKEILLAAAILWSAGGWGSRLLSSLSSPAAAGGGSKSGNPPTTAGLTELEKFLFAETLGLGCLSGLMIFLGVLHAWIPLGAWALLAIGVLGSGPFLINLKRLLSVASAPWSLPSEFFWPGAALLTGGILSFLLAFAPITYYDSLVYHFALPSAYLQARHWVALPHLIYSAFPQTLEMLWTLGLLVGDDTVSNLIAWSLSFLLLTAIIAYARRFFDLSVGVIAAALVAFMPAFLLLSTGGYVDIGLTLYGFMALYAACVWSDHQVPSLLMVSGLFAGWTIGTKYTGAITAVLIALFIALRLRRQTPGKTLQSLLSFGGSAVLIMSPWLIKNTFYVGNPVFPFFHDWGIKALNPWVNQAAAGYFIGLVEYYPHPFWELPGVVWEAAVNGMGFGRGIDVLGDYGWISLFGFLPALWFCRKLSSTVKLLLAFAGIHVVIWAMSRPVLRFLLPVSPLLALLAAYAWVQGIRTQPHVVRWLARGFMGSFLLSGLFLFCYVTSVFSPFKAALGLEGREAYLMRVLDNNYYGAATFVNTQTPLDSYVYVLGDQRGYYYQRKTWINPVFGKTPLIEWANVEVSPEALRQKLKREGVTHLLFNRAEFERLKIYPYSRFNEQGQRTWDRMRSDLLKPLYHDRACDVYAL